MPPSLAEQPSEGFLAQSQRTVGRGLEAAEMAYNRFRGRADTRLPQITEPRQELAGLQTGHHVDEAGRPFVPLADNNLTEQRMVLGGNWNWPAVGDIALDPGRQRQARSSMLTSDETDSLEPRQALETRVQRLHQEGNTLERSIEDAQADWAAAHIQTEEASSVLAEFDRQHPHIRLSSDERQRLQLFTQILRANPAVPAEDLVPAHSQALRNRILQEFEHPAGDDGQPRPFSLRSRPHAEQIADTWIAFARTQQVPAVGGAQIDPAPQQAWTALQTELANASNPQHPDRFARVPLVIAARRAQAQETQREEDLEGLMTQAQRMQTELAQTEERLRAHAGILEAESASGTIAESLTARWFENQEQQADIARRLAQLYPDNPELRTPNRGDFDPHLLSEQLSLEQRANRLLRGQLRLERNLSALELYYQRRMAVAPPTPSTAAATAAPTATPAPAATPAAPPTPPATPTATPPPATEQALADDRDTRLTKLRRASKIAGVIAGIVATGSGVGIGIGIAVIIANHFARKYALKSLDKDTIAANLAVNETGISADEKRRREARAARLRRIADGVYLGGAATNAFGWTFGLQSFGGVLTGVY